MQRSYDCPECDKAAFLVVKHLEILRCLICGCEWEFSLPPAEVAGDDLEAKVYRAAE